MKPRIAYISHYLPALTQTFVYREILALEEEGWSIVPFSIRKPTKGISEDAKDLASRTFYILPMRWGHFLLRQAKLFLAHPLRYLGILAFLISRPGESLRSRLHGFTHFFGGMHIVPELRSAGAAHIHAHFGQNPTTIAMAAAAYLRMPFSMTIHARDLFVDTALLRAKLEQAAFVVTISEFNRKLLDRLSRDDETRKKIHVLHCGIDIRKLAARGAAGPVPASGPVFFAVGRLVEKKGYIYLIEAAKLLEDRGTPFQVRIIGGGPDHDALARRIAELGLGDRVKLEGSMPQEKLLPLLRGADAFVLPCVQAKDGDQDGIPVSLMEAMAYGIPCISTTVSGVPELIGNGVEGLLVPEKEPAALADALETLAKDAGLRDTLGRAARKKVEAGFTLQGLVRDLQNLFLTHAKNPVATSHRRAYPRSGEESSNH